MGLDFVEIIMELEDTFEIEIEDDDWAGLVQQHDLTVADLYRVVQAKMERREVDRADIRLNLNLWKEMRSLLQSVTEVPQDEIRLHTRLAELFPCQRRLGLWERMRASRVFKIGSLEYPKLLTQSLGWSLLLSGVVIPIVVVSQFSPPFGAWVWLGVVSGAIFFLWILTLQFLYDRILSVCSTLRRSLPDHLVTVKDLCRSVRMGYSTAQKGPLAIPSARLKDENWSKFVRVLSEQLCIPLDEIKPESRLVKDLKMD